MCVFFPRPAARLALKAWAENKPAHLKRLTGGCLSCLENVPIRIGNEDLFHCVTIPGTTRQLVGCSSYKSVELHVRNITSARIALATRGLVGQIKNIPCSGAWLLELLKPPPKMRSLMEEPPQDAAAVGSAFVGGGEGNISVGQGDRLTTGQAFKPTPRLPWTPLPFPGGYPPLPLQYIFKPVNNVRNSN